MNSLEKRFTDFVVIFLQLWKNGFVSEVVPSGVTTAPTDYTFLDTENLKFRHAFSLLSIDLDTSDPGFVFYE